MFGVLVECPDQNIISRCSSVCSQVLIKACAHRNREPHRSYRYCFSGYPVHLGFVPLPKSLMVDMPLWLACSVCHSSPWCGDLYQEEDHLLRLMFISSIMYQSFVAIRQRSFLSGIASIDFCCRTGRLQRYYSVWLEWARHLK